MARRLPLPSIAPQATYVQTLATFTTEVRRQPTPSNKQVHLYYWSPTPTPAKQIARLLTELQTLGTKYYPKLEFVVMPQLELKECSSAGTKSQDLISRYRKEVYYVAGKLLDKVPGGAFARLLVTPVGLVSRPTMLTAGLARRETGVAIYSTYAEAENTTLMHELAHLLGIRHCTNACLMKAGSNGPLVKKKKKAVPQTFCAECQAKVDVACSAI